MPPRRIIFFLAVVVLIGIISAGLPYLEKVKQVSESVNTSPSSSPYGYKALYLLIKDLSGKSTEFWPHSIMSLPLDQPKTVWLTNPGRGLFFDGAVYAEKINKLVENGYHMIFILDSKSLELKDITEDKPIIVTDYLNRWYGLPIQTVAVEEIKDHAVISVKSNFSTRKIGNLEFENPFKTVKSSSNKERNKPFKLIAFDPSLAGHNAVSILTLENGNLPLAVMFRQGKGAITIFLNGFFLSNGQLDKGDNAAMAIALQEQFPGNSILFETHSSGFNDNKDIISYLATGKGITFFITSILMLIAFTLWLSSQPVKKICYLKSSDERYYTQETFIKALGQHYLSTKKWVELYKKMLQSFQADLEYRWPYYTQQERLHAIAQNPFIGLSLDKLESVFVLKNISSEESFVKKCHELFYVQRKVFNSEQPKSDFRKLSDNPVSR